MFKKNRDQNTPNKSKQKASEAWTPNTRPNTTKTRARGLPRWMTGKATRAQRMWTKCIARVTIGGRGEERRGSWFWRQSLVGSCPFRILLSVSFLETNQMSTARVNRSDRWHFTFCLTLIN
jgi:hypothetical protein